MNGKLGAAATAGDDDDDDYMSESFMGKLADVRPGVSGNIQSHRRQLRIDAERDEANERNRQRMPSKMELEKIKRDEALNTPIGQDTKGYELMLKMGYKPGTSLGKRREDGENDDTVSIREPITIDLKMNRTGIGHDTDKKAKSIERINAHCAHMAKRARKNNELIDEFRNRRRNENQQKQLIGDIVKSRRVCQELDARANVSLPAEPWFWPSYKKKRDDVTQVINDNVDDDDDEYVYANGISAMPEEQLDQFDDDELSARLGQLSIYLRDTYFYCIWCGHQYESVNDIRDSCPGSTKDDHDGDDDV